MRVRYTLNLYTDKKLDSDIADYVAEYPKGMERSEAIRTLIKIGYNTLVRHMDSQQAVEHSVNESDLKRVVELLSGFMKNAPIPTPAPQTNPEEMFKVMQMFEMMRGGGFYPADRYGFPSDVSHPQPNPPHMMQPGMQYPEAQSVQDTTGVCNHEETRVKHQQSSPVQQSTTQSTTSFQKVSETQSDSSDHAQQPVNTKKIEQNLKQSIEIKKNKVPVKPLNFDEEIIDPDLMMQNDEEGFVGFDLSDDESQIYDDDDFIDPLEMLGAKFGS